MIELSKWQLLLGKRNVYRHREGVKINGRLFPYPAMKSHASVKAFGPFLTLAWGDNSFLFFNSRSLQSEFSELLESRIGYWRNTLLPEFNKLVALSKEFEHQTAAKNRYIKTSYLDELISRFSSATNSVLNDKNLLALGFNIQLISENFRYFLDSPKDFQKKFNAEWVESELGNNANLFDSLEEHPLTERQRLSCVTDEDNILVLAGAGTGKTSTMVAKAKYLVVNGYSSPSEIMMLAYGSDAQKELEERVGEHHELKGVKVSTFHSSGKSIINYYEENSVSKLATDEKAYEKFVETQIEILLNNEKVGKDFKQFTTKYLYPKPNDLDFKSKGEYLHYVKDNDLRALSGDRVKSFEELTIANFLYSNGIKFEYEKIYPFPSDEPGRGSYQPDFYLPQFDLYLEHFGIDEKGNTRKDIDAVKYNEEMEWKRKFHRVNGTVLWETFSYQAKSPETLIAVLEQKIALYCQENDIPIEEVYKPVSPSNVYACLKELGIVSTFSKLIANFLSLFKASPYRLEAIELGKLDEYNRKRWQVFQRLFNWVYNEYQSVLEANKTIDFSDMIIKATSYAEKPDFHKNTNNEFKLKYLLVDEFQDISPIRASFIKALRTANPGCSLMGVGDDWQAIYRFTGSDVRLTTEFEKNFGASAILQLDKTFRFNDRIEKVASGFVQKNPVQIPKKLITHSKSNNPEVTIVKDNIERAISKVMRALGEPKGDTKPSVMFLSRFKKSLRTVKDLQLQYPQYEIKTMTAHGSKGKQADYVMILDVIDDKWGFPSKIETDSILLSLLPAVDDFKFSEERRLFYVALSRAKKSVFIHTELGRESVFIKELEENKEDIRVSLNDLSSLFLRQARCPECLEGNLVPRKGKYGLFYACSLGRNYCKTVVKVCTKCDKSPILPSDTHYVCASENCDHVIPRCPSCHSGMLIKRTNSMDGSIFWGCSNFRGNKPNSCVYRVNEEPVN